MPAEATWTKGFYPSGWKDEILPVYNYQREYKVCPETRDVAVKTQQDMTKVGRIYTIYDNSTIDPWFAHCTTAAIEVVQKAGLPVDYKEGSFIEPHSLARTKGFGKATPPGLPDPFGAPDFPPLPLPADDPFDLPMPPPPAPLPGPSIPEELR